MDMPDDLEQSDSGMESLTASKDETPERKCTCDDVQCIDPSHGSLAIKEFDDEPDETLSERLWGLTEMFPENVRNCSYKLYKKSWTGMKFVYGLSRTVVWIVASSSVILFAPVIFEVERAQVDEMQKSQQKQVLLGTNAGLPAGPSLAPPAR